MSKLHQALKKAEEERALILQAEKQNDPEWTDTASPPAVSSLMDPADRTSAPHVTFANSVANPVERRPPDSAASRDPKSQQRLRFEQLLKHCAKPSWVLDRHALLFSESGVTISGAEQFRTLRSRLYRLRETAPLKRVLVTSAMQGEGKTFVATNLAQAIACERDRPVLLIDGDLRSPKLHMPLGAPLSPGLSDYLCDRASECAIVQHGHAGNLCFIGAGDGRGSPSELLSNGRLERLLDSLGSLFVWIIVDSPPCLPVADANLLAKMCDGVVLVVRARSTPSAAIQTAHQELRGRNVVGVVLNAVEKADICSYGHGAANGHKAGGVRN
jgi:capsular exopolysaccharide synthesis family protein